MIVIVACIVNLVDLHWCSDTSYKSGCAFCHQCVWYFCEYYPHCGVAYHMLRIIHILINSSGFRDSVKGNIANEHFNQTLINHFEKKKNEC
ncbi:hypothetical protein T02_488 [Trichinella nativa]|uniref:Uncharacterized protein n=1 Tax=Trichinella nativa TaxID=6335 RepID=A0A0V1LIR4_9BILA|nr:hypothetical protein T02_488 [Trichinella nativa]